MRRPISTLAPLAALLALLACAGSADAKTGLADARGFAPRQLIVKFAGEATAKTLALPAGTGVLAGARALRDNPGVEYAEPNYIATASAASGETGFAIPNDPGTLEGGAEAASASGEWSFRQWNFLAPEAVAGSRLPTSPGGIDAVDAWQNLAQAGRPGAEGVTVAVLDTGIAYRSDGPKFARSPDFAAGQFVPGYDFVDGDRVPLDENGHGTHVAGTIAEKTGNGVGLTGLAYRAKLMPVRVLDSEGRGDAATIAKGLRFALAQHAQVINMSFNFGCGKKVPVIDELLRQAYKQGVVTVASAGNLGSETCVSEPATGPRTIAVGGSTEGGCLGDYSLAGRAIDVVAPGGGEPVGDCPSILARPIYQVTLDPGSTKAFSIPSDYIGTSMAAAHVSGVAAMVLARGRMHKGKNQLPATHVVVAVTDRLRESARDIGLPRTQQGAGLLDAAVATERPLFLR